MKNIVKDLKDISVKKHVVTSIEYTCKDEKQEDEVFETVRNVITENIDDFAKITFDVDADHKVKVEVIQD
ncbi:hypothetical protein [Floccifex sp.]|uniref:hypothetical protein n=1 Tax=Floccifex sp. TaxID=2815810 RepID=UPI003F10F986